MLCLLGNSTSTDETAASTQGKRDVLYGILIDFKQKEDTYNILKCTLQLLMLLFESDT